LGQAQDLTQGKVTLLSVRAGRVRDFTIGFNREPRDEWVWAVSVSGRFGGSCGPGPPCPPPNHAALVLLSYRTGRWIGTTTGPTPADIASVNSAHRT
jgi:hypothetical protein